MSRVCTVCRHPKRSAIDAALAALGSLRDIADRYAVSKTALQRHKGHAASATTTETALTVTERRQLLELARLRAKVAKSLVKDRAAAVLGDFEETLRTVHTPDDDEVIRRLTTEARDFVSGHDKLLAARCAELGIPDGYRPRFHFDWQAQGYALSYKLAELRKQAAAKVRSMEQRSNAALDRSLLEMQERLTAPALTSSAAAGVYAMLPEVDVLMPRLTFKEVAADNRWLAQRLGFYEEAEVDRLPLVAPATETLAALLDGPDEAGEGGAG